VVVVVVVCVPKFKFRTGSAWERLSRAKFSLNCEANIFCFKFSAYSILIIFL